MRRVFAIFMAVLVTLQFSWAAAASVCTHESSQAVQHVGHHAHEHKSAQSGSDHGGSPLKSVDNDCPVCHFGGPGAMSVHQAADQTTFARIRPSEPSQPKLPLVSEGPERPNWLAPA